MEEEKIITETEETAKQTESETIEKENTVTEAVEEEKTAPPKKSSVWKEIVFMALLIALTGYLLFKDENPKDILSLIWNSNKQFVLIGVLFILIYHFLESINLGRTLKALGVRSSKPRNYKYTLIGAFFSAVTPAATGGQPMEIYYMNRDGIKVADSTIALMVNLFAYQVATITCGIVGFIINFKTIISNKFMLPLFILGITINAAAFAVLFIGIFSERLSRGLVNGVIRIMKFFHIRNMEAKADKIRSVLAEYQKNSKFVKANMSVLIKAICTTMLQFIMYYVIAYWTYRALGFTEHNVFELASMQALVYAICSGLPLPGSVGASDLAFITIVGTIYPSAMIKSANLMTRGINFYLPLIISMVVVIVNKIRLNRLSAKAQK